MTAPLISIPDLWESLLPWFGLAWQPATKARVFSTATLFFHRFVFHHHLSRPLRDVLNRTCSLLIAALSVMLAHAQTEVVSFTSGPIPQCDTSVFTADVSGIGILNPPGIPWTYSMTDVEVNITTDHPQTLQIFLTSPEGTTVLLSAFNGAGGENYTNCHFVYDWWGGADIIQGAAPFNGYWAPQDPVGFSAFDYENGDGTWLITVIDTACVNGGTGPGGDWGPGWFDGDGSSNGGAFTIAFFQDPCWGFYIPDGNAYQCANEPVDIMAYYAMWGYQVTVFDGNYVQVPDPSVVAIPGTYYVEAYDMWNGCVASNYFVISSVNSGPFGPPVSVQGCVGSPIDLNALYLDGADFFQWYYNGSPMPNLSANAVNTPGFYQLQTGINTNCADTLTVMVEFLPPPQLGPDQAVNVCAGGQTDLSVLVNTAGANAEWFFNGGAIPPPVAASAPGEYSVTATTTGAACSDEVVLTLTEEPLPQLGPDQTAVTCTNASVDLTALFTTTGLISDWTYSGDPVGDPAAVTDPGAYRLVVTSNAGCADSAFVQLSGLPTPALGNDAEASTCDGGSVDLTMFFPTAGLTTAWTLTGSPVPNPAAVTTPGAYMLVASNAQACTDTAQVEVSIDANPVLGPDQAQVSCTGTPVDLTGLYDTGSDPSVWLFNGDPVADPAAITDPGTYQITVMNAAGCDAQALVTVTFDPAPTLPNDQTATICEGTSFNLQPLFNTTGSTPQWTLNNVVVGSPTAVSMAGDYQLVVVNAFNCTDTAHVMLSILPNPALGADRIFELCPWQTVDLGAVFAVGGANAVYTADGGSVSQPAAVHEPGTYLVAVADDHGCVDSALAVITNVECLCDADFSHEGKCLQDPVAFTLLADSAILGAQWTFTGMSLPLADIDPTVLFSGSEEITVTLVASLACGLDTIVRTITVPDCSDSCSVYIPSAFTPDADGNNDSWWWKGNCWPEEFLMYVFNRWGELIYTTTDPMSPWDGRYGGVMSQPDVYVYRVVYRLPYQLQEEAIGSITLVR